MDKKTVTQRIRERLDAGTLPRATAPLTREPGWPTSPVGHIHADTAIGVVRCAACNDVGAQLRFHGRCHRIWEEECHRGLERPDA